VLIPKKDNPRRVADFRSISLTHSFSKILTKILANRLEPELEDLISINQAAFIKKRSIHDNFMYVQEVIKDLHKKKVSAIFIKLDISKAFDSVNWPYLL
jgi:retron-type reverse transcriptase